MVEDRDFARSRVQFVAQWSVTHLLILANVLVYIWKMLSTPKGSRKSTINFALSVEGLKHGQVWQLFTAQFLHAPVNDGGAFHLLGNMFVIYLVGRGVEAALGKMRFLALYLLSGALGGLLQMAGGLFGQISLDWRWRGLRREPAA